jgi:hypothetical protein
MCRTCVVTFQGASHDDWTRVEVVAEELSGRVSELRGSSCRDYEVAEGGCERRSARPCQPDVGADFRHSALNRRPAVSTVSKEDVYVKMKTIRKNWNKAAARNPRSYIDWVRMAMQMYDHIIDGCGGRSLTAEESDLYQMLIQEYGRIRSF